MKIMDNNHNIDQGYAWVVLFGSCVTRLLVEGFISSIGILFVEWNQYFGTSASKVMAWIPALTLTFVYVTAPVASALAHRITYRRVAVGGGILSFISLLLASFANQVWHLCLAITILGIGLGMSSQACVIYIVYYFSKKFATANSINSSSSAVGSLLLPPLIQILIQVYGISGALRITAAIMINMSVFSMLFRPSASETCQPGDKADNSFAKSLCRHFDMTLFKGNIHFIFTAIIGGFLFGVSNSTDKVYIVPYAVDVGMSPMRAAFLVSFVGVAGFIGRAVTALIPHGRPALTSRLAGLSQALCGLFAIAVTTTTKYGGMTTILLLFGICSGVGSALRIIVVKNSVETSEASGAMAWWSVLEGIGSLVGVYLAGLFYDVTESFRPSFYISGAVRIILGGILFADPCIYKWQKSLVKGRQRSKGSEDV